jgi:ABC-2 type transport system ATP-binding protein
MISVSQLTKRYGRHTAVDNLTFDVGKGEVLGFLGPNGAGKTTTMRMLTGYLPPSKGRIKVDGFDLYERPIDCKRRIGYLPENPPLYPDMTVRKFLEFVAEIKDVPARGRADAVQRAIARTRLEEVAGKRIAKLSKGYRQRVGLAQAIVHDPPVLILDEPTSSLDPKQRVEVRDLIAGLRGSHTVILSTHILSEVSTIADRVFILNRGKVMAVDSPANLGLRLRARELVKVEIAARTPEDGAEALSRDTGGEAKASPCIEQVKAALAQVPGALRVDVERQESGTVHAQVESAVGHDIRAEVADLVIARGWRLLSLGGESLSLEEIFLKLTDEGEPRA